MGVYKKTAREIAVYLGGKIKGGKDGLWDTPVYRIEYD